MLIYQLLVPKSGPFGQFCSILQPSAEQEPQTHVAAGLQGSWHCAYALVWRMLA